MAYNLVLDSNEYYPFKTYYKFSLKFYNPQVHINPNVPLPHVKTGGAQTF